VSSYKQLIIKHLSQSIHFFNELPMQITNPQVIERIEKKINKCFDLDTYFDYCLLSGDAFTTKKGSFGYSFSNFFEIRFEVEAEIIPQIELFLADEATYYVIPVAFEKAIFEIESGKMTAFFLENKINTDDFILFDKKMNWALVKNKYRKLIGIGNFIHKKMKKQVHVRFGNARIMYSISDK
jgi:hypothetical protein